MILSQCVSGQSWLSPWENRQSLTVTNYNYVPMVEFQTRLEIPYTAGMQSDFDDLRFTNNYNSELLPYWIEYSDASKAVVWVQLDSIAPFGSADYYLYYGNGAAEQASDPYETFIFYDDFDTDNGWQEMGLVPSTAMVMYDSLTSTLNKYDGCNPNGAWKSIGESMSNFKLISREFMPAESDPECTTLEYGIETADFSGINLIREGMDTGSGTPFGLQKRNGASTSGTTTTIADQPAGNWYRTSLSYAYVCHFNLHAMMFTDDMNVVGNVYSETYDSYNFDRFTVRGGHTYYMDYVAVAKHLCVWPVVKFLDLETCPQGTLVEFQDDLCDEGLGEIVLNISGGIAPYAVTWYMGQDSLGTYMLDTIGQVTLDSLSAGDYCFKITDAGGCEN